MIRSLLLFVLPIFIFAGNFKIASYNVENLFDGVKNGTEYSEYIPGKHNWSKRMADIKLTHISEVICDLDADIIALQEVENENILKQLRQKLKRVGCNYPYQSIANKKNTSIKVALLSRYPIAKEREIQVNYSSRDRNILEATVKLDSRPLTIYVNHWKAKSRSGYESRRINYARALAKRIKSFPEGSEYIIVGDLNSNYDEYRQLSKRLNDTGGKTGINHTLGTTIAGKLITKEQMVTHRQAGHYNLWLELEPAKRWSHKYYAHRGSVDHILLPSSLFDGKGIDYLNNSYGVFRPPYLFTKQGWINSWAYSGSRHKGRGYSDHLPIYATFTTDPYVAQKIQKPLPKKIKDLYEVEHLMDPAELESCVVILKRGSNAIIKQSPTSEAIYIFGAASDLKQGHSYDLVATKIATYKGLKEIVRIEQIKDRGAIELDRYYLHQDQLRGGAKLEQNQVFVNLVGTYSHNHLEVAGRRIPIYFKKRSNRPKDGTRLKIFYAHMGYYRKAQLVIYDRNDFEIMEK